MVKDLFLYILNLSVTASFAALAVMTVRYLLRKAPKKYAYALWIVVAFRLLCPVSFTADVSLLNAAPRSASLTLGEYPVSQMAYFSSREAEPQTSVSDPSLQEGEETVLPAVLPEKKLDVTMVAAYAWLAVAVILLVRGAKAVVKLRRQLRDARHLNSNVYACSGFPSPFVFGVLHPKIYLPDTMEIKDAAYILAHERYHIRRGDHIVKLAAYGLLCMHWFNPLMWLSFQMMERDMEMSCDEYVLLSYGSIGREYSSLLLGFAENAKTLYAPLSFGESDVAARIRNALRFQPQKKTAAFVSLLAVCLAVIGCAVNPSAGGSTDTHDEPVSSSVGETASVVWCVLPSMELDKVSEPAGYYATFVKKDGVFIRADTVNIEGYFQSFFADWAADAVIVTKDGKQGFYDYSGNELYPVTAEISDVYDIGISRFLTSEEDMPVYASLAGRSKGLGGPGIVFARDFRSAHECEEVLIDPFEGDGFPPCQMVIYDGEYGMADWYTGAFEKTPGRQAYEICRVWENGAQTEKRVLVYEGEIIADVDAKYDFQGLINGYYRYYSEVADSEQKGIVYALENRRITEAVYEDIKWFEDGLCPVKYNGKWGYVNEQGQPVTEYIFEDASTLYDGRAYVKIDGLYGILDFDRTMAEGIPVTYETCTNAWQKEEVLMRAAVVTDVLNIRSAPSTDASIIAAAVYGKEYPVYEVREDSMYTWYRIGKDRWIADDGTWLQLSGGE